MILLWIDLSFLWSPRDYWYAFVSAALGAYLGIWWTLRQFKSQKNEFNTNCVRQLRACVEFNLDRLRHAQRQLAGDTVPNYPFDTAQFNHWLSQSHDSLPPGLIRELDWQRFQLDHISSKFIVVNSAIVSTVGEQLNAAQLEHRKAIVAALAKHVDRVLHELPLLLRKLPDTP